ncbi:Fc.00g108570.m01.CDS01 [Cosmosporella sp. VM-42]
MSVPDKFQGFQSPSADRWLEFEKGSWEPRPFGDHDIDIKIDCCGVCASDRHTISGDWGGCPYPLAVGHEVVGKVLRVGSKVTLAKVGQRVGCGAQVYSCRDCRQCKNDNETYCKDQIDAYGAPYLDTGYTTQGGYSSHTRIDEYWVYPIPEALPSTEAAPMLCAGITVYSPLKRLGAGPGKKVGIVGIGGLGHYGVLFAKALGAEVWAISRSRAKEADAKKMGADGFLATGEKNWTEGHKMTFDIIINTATSFDGFALSEYLSLLDVHGHWNSVGLPGGEGISVRNQDFISNGCFIGSSHLGSRREMLEMLQLAADKGIKSWVEEIPISTEGLQKAMDNLKTSSVRYRSCMTNFDEASNPETSTLAERSRLKLALRSQRSCSRSEISAVDISPATSTAFAIYTAGQTTQSWIDVFDLDTQRGHSKTTGSHAVFGPQGSRLATVRDWTVQLAGGVEYQHSSTVLVRDFATGKTAMELKEAKGEPLVWSRDGRVIASGEGGGRMSVWDVKNGTRVGRVVSHIDTVTHAAFTPDLHLVTLSRDGTLRITSPTTMKTISRLEIPSTNPRLLSVSTNGQRIVSVWGTMVYIWFPHTNDLTTYNLNAVRQTEGWPLCISPDSRYMLSWTEDGFDVMDVVTGSVVFEQRRDVLITSGAWSSDGKVVVLGRIDGVVEVWDVEEKN